VSPPSRAQLERNLSLYPVYAALSFTPVAIPVLVIFFQENGLDMFEIYLLQAAFALAVAAFEVPGGLIADRVGKRKSLMMGFAIGGSAWVLYAMGHGFRTFLLCEVILAVGASLISGADSALLYDTLKALDREAEFEEHEGRARGYMMVTFAVCNILGGWIGTTSTRATLWAELVGPILAIVILVRMVEVQPVAPDKSLANAWKGYRTLVSDSTRFIRRHSYVRWHVVLMSLLIASATLLLWTYQPYMEVCGLPIWGFGVAFASFNLVSAGASRYAHKLEPALGPRKTLVLLMALEVATPLLMAILLHPAAFMAIWCHQLVRGSGRPILHAHILKFTFADKRATVLSFVSLSGRLLFAVLAPAVGWMAKVTSIQFTLSILAGAMAVAFSLMWIAYGRIPEKYFSVKDEVIDKL
jgi:MFS family permease